MLGLRLQLLAGFVQLQVLTDLLKKLENILWCLILHGPLEDRSHYFVSHLNVFSVMRQEQESLCVFFISFAALQEHHKSLECALFDFIFVLQKVLHGGSEKHRVLLVDTNEGDHINQVTWHRFGTFIQDQKLKDFLKVLFLGMQSDRLEQTDISLLRHLEVLVMEDISNKQVFFITSLSLFLGRDRGNKHLEEHVP